MNPERFTEKAREAIAGAQKLAARMDHQSIDVEHLLLSLLDQEKGLTAAVLNKAGISVDALTIRVQREVEKFPKVANVSNQGITARFSKVLPTTNPDGAALANWMTLALVSLCATRMVPLSPSALSAAIFVMPPFR